MAEAAPTYRQKYGYLPAVACLLAETVGEDAMLKITADLGGTQISVGPKSLPSSRLVAVVGAAQAGAIFARARADGLLRLDIPRMTRTLEMWRHDRVLRLRAAATKITEIALTLGMTERHVYRVLAADRAAPDPRQLLFPF